MLRQVLHFMVLALALLATPPVSAQQGQTQWLYSRAVSLDPMQTSLGLYYGVPFTGDVSFELNCRLDANGPHINAGLYADIGARRDGQFDTMLISGPGGGDIRIQGLLFDARDDFGISGMTVDLALEHPLFQALFSRPSLTLSLPGAYPNQIPTSSGRADIQAFLADCAAIASLDARTHPPIGQPAPLPVDQNCERLGWILSQGDSFPMRVEIRNEMAEPRVLFWLDNNGQGHQLAYIEPGSSVWSETYSSHAILITDANSNCRAIYLPQVGDAEFAIRH